MLYGCRISDCCWNRTVFHGERHCRILIISCSGCREYTLPRDEEASQPKGWIRGNTKIGPVLEVATCCLQGKYGVEIRIMSVNRRQFSLLGQNFWWIKQICDEFWPTTSRKFQKFSSKNMRWNWMRRILHADQKPKQNHKEENLPALHQEQFLLGKEFGLMLNQGIFNLRLWHIEEIDSSSSSWKTSTSRRWWSGWIPGESKTIFRHISCIVIIGLTTSGRRAWQEEEETRTDTSTVLILKE